MHAYILTYIQTYLHTYVHTLTYYYITLHYITLRYATLRYVTLHHITVQYSTLHYTTDKRTYGHTDIQTYRQTYRHAGIQTYRESLNFFMNSHVVRKFRPPPSQAAGSCLSQRIARRETCSIMKGVQLCSYFELQLG